MYRKIVLLCISVLSVISLTAQDTTNNAATTDFASEDGTIEAKDATQQKNDLPPISYSLTNNKKYTIADIKLSGVESFDYEDYVLIGVSGLSVGQKISVPGEEITKAINTFWKYGMFSDVAISRTHQTEDSVWLEIHLKPNPIISEIQYKGVKKGEREDLEAKIGMAVGTQITPNIINRAKKRAKDYFDTKGFSNADITVRQHNDLSNEGKSILEIDVDKKEKTKITEIVIRGNENISEYDLKMAMKKTNEGFSLRKHPKLSIRKLFSTKKYVPDEYENDLENILLKYSERGYRDAEIVSDSIVQVDDKHVSIYIDIQEGNKYHIRDIKWVGNTLFPTEGPWGLNAMLGLGAQDVYNQKKLNERLLTDEDAVSNLYYNNGYIFASLDPVEVHAENDSVDIEIRISEGIQATINKVIINGNDRIYEDIVRRELLTKPGQLFSRDILMQTYREIAQMGHFDPENIDIQTPPDPESGTVDIVYNLTSRANDQVEFSAGWGQTGVIGKLSLKFTNFSLTNLLNPSSYKGIIPQGEGQTLTLSGQTNGSYYQSYSVSFFDPWFGGKRPNSFSLSAYYTATTGVDSRYYNNYYSNYYSNYYGYSDYAYDENQSMKIFGISAGYGKRLSWPDHLFTFMAELSYQRYMLNNWNYFVIQNGNANSLALGLTISRNSTDNPIYTRSGSQFSLSVNFTPPYSLFDNVDYASLPADDPKLNEWIEFHKWKFKGKIFIPLADREKVKRTPVLMGRMEYGFLGSYNSHKRTPFETYYMGGDGMSGYSSYMAQETVGLRGYENGSLTPYGNEGYAYARLAMELRYPFIFEQSTTIFGLLFAEAGNAWNQISHFNPFDLKRSAGVGVRIYLPMIGLMGIDWAYGFDRATPSSNTSGGQFHFILGQEF
ncbi:outer membrane protein assembly factor BamA [Bacteroidales bacterium OttesenSCG-928-A17]|nr:outer membrane protein assembly factor BamA [Bacteroidales bacterium OttesenSCG-928-A17]